MSSVPPSSAPGNGLMQKAIGSLRPLLLALGFLTRLCPPLVSLSVDEDGLRKAVVWYPAAGALLGLVLILPFSLGLLSGHAYVQAWLYAGLSAYLTRALHLDGLADVLDALGSAKTGDGFFAVLKDSRLGAFGAVGLALVISGQIILVAACLESGRLAPLFFAPVFGRCLPIVLAATTPPNPKASLGLLLATAPVARALFVAAAVALAGGFWCLSSPGLLLCAVLSCCCLFFLHRLAKREGGYNGDFLGCAIISGELVALLAALV